MNNTVLRGRVVEYINNGNVVRGSIGGTKYRSDKPKMLNAKHSSSSKRHVLNKINPLQPTSDITTNQPSPPQPTSDITTNQPSPPQPTSDTTTNHPLQPLTKNR